MFPQHNHLDMFKEKNIYWRKFKNMKIKKKRKELKKEFSIQNFLMKCKENFIMIVLQLRLPAVLIEYALYHK